MVEAHYYAIGERIAAARRDRGWTQEDLAYHAGLTVRTISRAENGEREARGLTLRKIASALTVPVGELIGIMAAQPLGPDDRLDRIEEKLDAVLALLSPEGSIADVLASEPDAPENEHGSAPRKPAPRRRGQG